MTTAAALALPASALASTDPVFSNFVSNSSTLAGATAVAVSGNFAYATSYGSGQLTAIDLSNPAQPAIANSSTSSTNTLNASGITIANGYAYVVSKNRNGPCMPGPSPNCGAGTNNDGSGNSLTVFDIHTNPAQPTEVGHLHDASNLFGAYGIAVSGTDAYVAAQGCLSGQPCPDHTVGNSFSTLDVTNPTPAPITTVHNNGAGWTGTNDLDHADSVAVSGGFAYVTAFLGNRLTIIDVSNPAAPRVVAALLDPAINFPNDVAVQGTYAFVAEQNSVGSGLPEFAVVDVSTQSAPRVVASITNPSLAGAYRIEISGDFAYVAASSGMAMNVIDISDPLNPRWVWGPTDDAHFWHATGVSLDSTGQYLVGSSPLQMGQSSPLYPPFGTNTGTVSTIALEPTPATVAITASSEPPATGASGTADFQFAASNTVEAVQCRLDTQAFAPCTSQGSQQYANLADGSHTFTVEGIDSSGTAFPANYTWTVGAGGGGSTNSPPGSTQAPVIAGPAVVGATLTTSGGTWSGSPAPALAYAWQRCTALGTGCVPIAGATAASYVPQGADKGSTLEVIVTATNVAGSALATSTPTDVVSSPVQSGIGNTGATGDTGTTGSTGTAGTTGTTRGKAKVEKLAVRHRHGVYVLHLTLSSAATVKVTLRRTSPHRAVVETTTKKVSKGSSTIRLKLHASTAAARLTRYEAVVKAPGGTKQLTFSVRLTPRRRQSTARR